MIKIDSAFFLIDKKGTNLKCFAYSIFDSMVIGFNSNITICEEFLYKSSNYGLFTLNLGDRIDAGTYSFECYFEPNGYKFILVDSAECNTVSINGTNIIETFHRIYPNPAQSTLNIEHNYPIQSVELFNAEGKLALNKKQTGSLDITEIPNGLYLLKIGFQNNTSHFSKVVIQH